MAFKPVPVIGEIDSWLDSSESWQDKAYWKTRRIINGNLIQLTIVSPFLVKLAGACKITSGVLLGMINTGDWSKLKSYFDKMSDKDAKSTYLWLHAGPALT